MFHSILLATTKKYIQGIPMTHIAMGLAVMTFLFVLPALFDAKRFKAALEEFFGLPNAVFRLASLVHLGIAFLILNTHHTIKFSGTRSTVLLSIMTIVGYLILARGAVWLWFPSFVKSKTKKFLNKEAFLPIVTIVGVLLAIGFGYLGLSGIMKG